MLVILLCAAFLTAPASPAPAIELPVIEHLPDPFLFADGHRVATQQDWQARRTAIIDLLLTYQYGHIPPPPGNVHVTEELDSGLRFEDKVRYRKVRLGFGPDAKLKMTTYLYLPAQGKGPFPILVRFGHDESKFMPFIENGYAYACFEQTELDPDTEGYDEVGPAQRAYPDCDWGSIAVWAWGASRVMDWIETLPDVEASKSIITGHSRTGKAALLAGALDKRFAMVVPNGSGCGGAAAYRIKVADSETLELITRPGRFMSWFQEDFGRFGGKENRLPFDQHFLRALVAPRLLLTTDALGDTWCNPPGTQAAWLGAQPVFDFLGVPDHNRCHFREGSHDQTEEDYQVLLEVAQWYFKGIALTRDFSTLPVPDYKRGWTWTEPGKSPHVSEK